MQVCLLYCCRCRPQKAALPVLGDRGANSINLCRKFDVMVNNALDTK